MQFQVDGQLASRLYGVAAAQERDLDDVLHEAILEYVQHWEAEHLKDFDAEIERIMKEQAWLLEQLGKGPD